MNNTPIGDTKLDHYIDVDFGTAPINYKGVRITERVSGSEYNKITIYGKNADNDEWVKLFEGAATKEAPASNDLMFAESVNYRYMRMKFDGKSEHVTADIIHIIKGDFVNVQITPAGGNVTVNNVPSMGDNFVAPNREITFTATPNENENGGFMYWVEANTGRILGRETSLTVSSASGKDIKAVFADPAETEVFVSFFGRDKNTVIAHSYVNKGGTPVAPSIEKLYTTGYEFGYWMDKNGVKIDETAAVNANTDFYARYTKKAEKRSIVKVEGGKVSLAYSDAASATEATYAYDTFVKVTADDPESGKKFSHWEMEGEIVSYSKAYKFYVPDYDITLTAVFVDNGTTIKEEVNITMTNTLDSVNGISVASFLTTRYVPEGVNVIETGVIYVKDASYGELTLKEIGKTSQNGKAVKVALCGNTASGQYKLTASYAEFGIKAVGFITYKDGNNAVTVYTEELEVNPS